MSYVIRLAGETTALKLNNHKEDHYIYACVTSISLTNLWIAFKRYFIKGTDKLQYVIMFSW